MKMNNINNKSKAKQEKKFEINKNVQCGKQ